MKVYQPLVYSRGSGGRQRVVRGPWINFRHFSFGCKIRFSRDLCEYRSEMIWEKPKNEWASTNWKVIWIDISFPSPADNKRLKKKSESKFRLLFKESEIKEFIATLGSFCEKKINGYSRRVNRKNINSSRINNNEKWRIFIQYRKTNQSYEFNISSSFLRFFNYIFCDSNCAECVVIFI